mgnify:CR=1 FL=1
MTTGPGRSAAARRRRRGFTLLELLVAITLLGLIMTMAFSGFIVNGFSPFS